MADWIPNATDVDAVGIPGCSRVMSSWQITFVDFIMYELLDQHRMFQPSCLGDFKNLKDLLDRFEVSEVRREQRSRAISVSGMLSAFRLWRRSQPT